MDLYHQLEREGKKDREILISWINLILRKCDFQISINLFHYYNTCIEKIIIKDIEKERFSYENVFEINTG